VFAITMVLANAPGKPDGDVSDRVVIQAALTLQTILDDAAHDDAGGSWPAERTRADGTTRALELVRLDGEWSMRSTRGEDEPLWRVEARSIRPGEYVTLHRPDGDSLMYRVVGVDEVRDQADVISA